MFACIKKCSYNIYFIFVEIYVCMIRTILLLFPIYITLFWFVTLSGNKKKLSAPRLYLSKFMLYPFVIFVSHFLYFSPYPTLYLYSDIPLQYASLLVFPVYYIYFRLLTVDGTFTLKKHARYLAIPTIIAGIYAVGVSQTPTDEYRAWLFDEKAYPDSSYIAFLNIIRLVIRITYLLQVVISVAGNYWLIRKYGEKAEEFYSNIQDGKYNNAKLLNYSIIFMGIAAFTFTALGRQYLMNHDEFIYAGWSVFSGNLFFIGFMGITQKPINPTFELENNEEEFNRMKEVPVGTQKKLLIKILFQFDEKKLYLNSQLNIMDVVKAVGTNRSYISGIINSRYNQNFCSFVNGYRIVELEKAIVENPDSTNESLAESCGFGSVNSLKRAVSSKTGMSLTEWKKFKLAQHFTSKP